MFVPSRNQIRDLQLNDPVPPLQHDFIYSTQHKNYLRDCTKSVITTEIWINLYIYNLSKERYPTYALTIDTLVIILKLLTHIIPAKEFCFFARVLVNISWQVRRRRLKVFVPLNMIVNTILSVHRRFKLCGDNTLPFQSANFVLSV